MSLAVAVVILWSSIGLLKESVWMSLAGVPSGIDVDEVEAELGELDGVDDGPRPPRLAAEHDRDRADRASRRAGVESTDDLLASARAMLHDRFRIEHSTIQVERQPPRRLQRLLMADVVTHLECSLTGERYEAGQVHNLSRAGQAAAGALRPRSRRGER